MTRKSDPTITLAARNGGIVRGAVWRGAALAVLAAGVWLASGSGIVRLMAQDEGLSVDEAAATVDSAARTGAPPAERSAANDRPRSLLGSIFTGGVFGVAISLSIILLSMVSVAFIVEHLISIRKSALMPDFVLDELEQLIAARQIDEAIEYCCQPQNQSMATSCVLAGLERFKGSEFGFAEYKSAVEEAGEDQTGRLYRKTEVLGVIGSIAPMLGLTGTVLGMIQAFNVIASRQGMAKPDELAGGISTALVTTLLGLLVAIPSMVAFSYFRNKIDSIVAEAGKRIERIMMPLGRQK